MEWTDAHAISRWVFRGLGDKRYDLVPSAGRNPESYDLAAEQAVLDVFKRRATEFLGTGQLATNWDALAVAQHHGAPTRLMDWTHNPLVACYFAVKSDPMQKGGDAQIVAKQATHRTIIDIEEHPEPFACDIDGFVLPRFLTNRISHQNGLFSFHASPIKPFFTPSRTPKDCFVIEDEFRAYFERKLFYFGFDPQRIMGGLDGIGARLKWQYDRNIALGAVR